MDYSLLADAYRKLSETSKRLEKTAIIAEFLTSVPDDDLEAATLLLQGRVFPKWDKRTLGVSSKLAAKAIATTTGASEKEVHDLWRKHGDLGKVSELLLSKKKQATLFTKTLTLKEVMMTLRKLPEVEGMGSVTKKLQFISSLVSAAKPEDAKYILGTVLEALRLGIAEGTLRDAIAWSFLETPVKDGQIIDEKREEYNKIVNVVQAAYDRCSDFAQVAHAAKKGGIGELKTITFVIGTPVRVMLAQREATVASALERVSKPCALEYKYDGFRMQIHKDGDTVRIFTRRLEEVTIQFPEVVAYAKKYVAAKTALLDGEAVGFDKKTGKYTPFQAISQRIRRKYDIDEISKKLPIELCLFDILYLDGEEVLDKPFVERRKLLRTALPEDHDKEIRLSQYLETADEAEGEAFYKEALAAGNEGVMAKNLQGPYKPGARVGHMVKVKPTLETVDLVIVAAEWGEGKRSGWFTSFTLACYDPIEDEFLTIGKVGTGLKELDNEDPEVVTFDKLTKLLQDDVITETGRKVTVKPRIVIEVKSEEIQQSPTYEAGFALRFPRVVRLREDRSPDSATDIEEVRLAFKQQKH
ncbi:ATP-dependent DNA ligase [Candidatus Woesearchaeota archaeon]|nr:ATP-dependent DNA ligase [Candidatus Woesearchaeota archaeon]